METLLENLKSLKNRCIFLTTEARCLELQSLAEFLTKNEKFELEGLVDKDYEKALSMKSLDDLKLFFESNTKDNKMVVLYYPSSNPAIKSEDGMFDLTYQFISEIFYHKSESDSRLLIIIFAENSKVWVDTCKSNFHFDRISVQSFDIKNTPEYQSLSKNILNNIVVINQIAEVKDRSGDNVFCSPHEKLLRSFLISSLDKDEAYTNCPSFIGEYFDVKTNFSSLECMFDSLKQLEDLSNYIITNNGQEEYTGEFSIFGRSGRGCLVTVNNEYKMGLFKNDKLDGLCHITNLDLKTRWICHFKNGEPQGKAVVEFPNCIFSGEFQDKIGIGMLKRLNGTFFANVQYDITSGLLISSDPELDGKKISEIEYC